MSEAEDIPTTEDALTAAYDKQVELEAEGTEEEVVTEEETTDATDEETVDTVSDDDAETETEEEDDAAEETSGEDDADETVASEEDEETDDTDAAAEPAATAPQAWKPLARESWADVPPAAQEEILRREQEIEKKLGEVSDKSGRASAFEEAVAPFQQTINVEAGGDPIAATRNLMGVATRLRMGTPAEKALVVRDIITQYGVSLDEINRYLGDEGAAPFNQGAPQPGAFNQQSAFPAPTDPRVEQMWKQQQASQQQAQQSATNEVEQFIGSKEWGNDVRDDMADVMDLAGRRGERLTLDQAYDKAVALRPDLQQIVQQRAQRQTAASDEKSLKRKKRSSKQIKGTTGGPPPSEKPKTLRETIEANMDEQMSG